VQKSMVAAVALVSVAGCTAAPNAGSPLTLIGEIHVKGNEPFPTVMLETDSHVVWELSGLDVAQARPFTGQRVTVRGTVLRAPDSHTWLPAIRLDGSPVLAPR